MSHRPAQQTAHHVTAAFVRRQDAIRNHHGDATGMVGNHFQRDIGANSLAVFNPGHFHRMLDNREQQVRFKVGLFVLQHRRDPFQTCAGIDVLFGQRRVVAGFITVKLGEHQIPDFQIAVAVATYSAIRFTAATLFAQIHIEFRAGAARAGTDLPEIIRHPDNPLRRQADILVPNFKRFVIIGINRNPELVRRQAQFFGDKFPGPGYRFFFEIIAERKIAQHLKKSMMTGRATDIFDIAGTDATLRGGDPQLGRLHLAGKKRLERSHAGADQQQTRVIIGDERITGQNQMFFPSKELQVFLSQFISGHSS